MFARSWYFQSTMNYLIITAIPIIITLYYTCYHLIYQYRKPTSSMTRSLMIVLGSGGHTTEMLRMVATLSNTVYTPRIYIIATSDFLSELKLREVDQTSVILKIPRARSVHQSWLTTPFTLLRAILASISIIAQKPDLLLTNGPGTCIPLVILSKLAAVKVLYIESVCRVKQLSLSGLICYYMSDKVLVQWPTLTQKYPKTEYHGRLV